jgi:hypothetical protein
MSLTTEQIQTIGLCIQSGAIFLTLIGVGITVWRTAVIARRRATLDLLMAEETGQRAETRAKFLKLKAAGPLAKWAEPANVSSDESATLRAVLNQYELLAIGIKEGSIAASMYKRWGRTKLVNDWLIFKPMVMQLRQNTHRNTYYCEFEQLAKKWAQKSELNGM